MGRVAPSEAVVQEALVELAQYLSDQMAPLMVADSMTVLTRVPPRRVAEELAQWAAAQQAGGGLPLVDYYFHGLRKVQVVGELGLVHLSLFEPFFNRVQAAVLEGVAEPDRTDLAAKLVRLGETKTVSVAQVQHLHRPEDEEVGPAEPAGAAFQPAQQGGLRLNLPASFGKDPQAVRRLTALLRRLGDLEPDAAPAQRDTLAAEAFAMVAPAAASSADMEAHIEEFRSAGLGKSTYDLFHVLGDNLPGWWAPDLPTPDETDPGLAAMERLITLAENRVEAARRFREMVENAIEQFNAGELGRAVRMFDLALKMTSRGEVLSESVESLRERGHEALDPERMKELLEEGRPPGFPRVVLRFFHALSPERLLDELRIEERRERRQMLLRLVETQGDDGREAVFDRLVRRPDELADLYVFRNLIHLLRRIPRSVNTAWPQEHEIARAIRFLVPESPPFVIREIVSYLAAAKHDVAEQALRLFVGTLEGALLSPGVEPEEHVRLRSCLDDTCRALAASEEPPTWEVLIEHGLREEPLFGDTHQRLSSLGRWDLSNAPEVVNRLIDAALEEAGNRVRSKAAPRANDKLLGIVSALAGTRAPRVLALLGTVAKRLPDEEAGAEAARALRELERDPAEEEIKKGSLLGDLGLFGLPAVLQSLADLRSTGTITLTNEDGAAAARISIQSGRVRDAEVGELRGRDAVWQLIERPFPGRFSFVPDPGDAKGSGEAHDVTPLLLEGMQRHDELRSAETLIPADVPVSLKGREPPPVLGEEDADLLSALWQAFAAGATVGECERACATDAFRIWRAVARWVEADALEPGLVLSSSGASSRSPEDDEISAVES